MTIRFPCSCGQPYEIAHERAGTSFQCTRCGRLIDVPALNDLAHLAADGTYGLDETPLPPHESGSLDELMLAYTREKLDSFGNPIDLRNTQADFAGIGEPEVLDFSDEQPGVRRVAPRYDPMTGELIRSLEVTETSGPADPQAAPLAKAMIAYARHRAGEQPFRAVQIVPEMFRATNMVVLMVIFVVHVFLQFLLFALMIGMWLIMPAILVLAGLVLSHYAVVVNEIATEDRDELPRPLRDFSWHDDLWGPFIHFCTALLIAYGPAIAIAWLPRNGVLIVAYAAAVGLFGTMVFPALFLTTTTSGHWLNLSPDRVLRVMRNLGLKYILCVMLWIAAAVSYFIGIAGTMTALAMLVTQSGGQPWISVAVAYPLLMAGILLMHMFCWYLGLQYRQHQPTFGWALQSHYSRNPEPRPKQGFAVVPPVDTSAGRRARMQGQGPVRAVPVQPISSPPQQPPP